MRLKDKELKRQKQETVTNQVLLVFVSAAVLLWGISYLYRLIDRPTSYLAGLMVTRVLALASLALAAGALVWFLMLRKQGKLSETAVFHPGILALFFAACALCCGILLLSPVLGMRLVYVLVPCLAILYLVFRIYDRQFFTMCVTHGFALFSFYLSYRFAAGSGMRLFGLVFALALCVLAVVLLWLPEKGALRRIFLGQGVGRRFWLLLYGVTAVGLLAAFLLSGVPALILLLAAVAYLVGAAIYFTVKLI